MFATRLCLLAALLLSSPPGVLAQINTGEISESHRGMGIDPEDLDQIFEPFYRSRAVQVAQIHGTGLRLAVAKQIAEALGGSITVTSVPGEGSTFTLRLRRYEATSPAIVEPHTESRSYA